MTNDRSRKLREYQAGKYKKTTPRDTIFKLQKVKDDKKILKDPGGVVGGGEPLSRKEQR